MDKQIITTENRYTFDEDAISTLKEVINGAKIPKTGTEGYFGDTLDELYDAIRAGSANKLHHCEIDPCPFFKSDSINYALFLPIDAVNIQKKEKKYRSFKTILEFSFIVQCTLGQPLTYRVKDHEIVYTELFTGYSQNNNELMNIQFSSSYYSPNELFNKYEWQDNNGLWHPFGVEIGENKND